MLIGRYEAEPQHYGIVRERLAETPWPTAPASKRQPSWDWWNRMCTTSAGKSGRVARSSGPVTGSHGSPIGPGRLWRPTGGPCCPESACSVAWTDGRPVTTTASA
jgi:hypothetical protein